MKTVRDSKLILIDSMSVYLNQISKYKLLTKSDEQRLGRIMHEGRESNHKILSKGKKKLTVSEGRQLQKKIELGENAERQFVESNLRLVVSIANKRSKNPTEVLEMIQEGNIGLIEAVRRFDYRRGFKFSTYATYWIKQAIDKGWNESRHPITLPRKIRHKIVSLKSAHRELHTSLGHEPTVSEMSEYTGLSILEIQKLTILQESYVSIDKYVGSDKDSERFENFIQVHSDYQAIDRLDEIEYLFRRANLDEEEKQFLILYFGIGIDKEEYTSKEIAFFIGKSDSFVSEKIRQAKAKVLSLVDQPDEL